MSSVKNVIKDNYNMMRLKDYLKQSVKEAGFSSVDIQKTPTGTRVSLHVTRPGIVIGRKGSGIQALTEKLERDFSLKNPQIAVVEVEKPELQPSVMCNRIAQHISRGVAFRRAIMYALSNIMNAGAMGVQITVSGKLRGDRASFEKHQQGVLPKAGYQADVVVSEDVSHVETPMGILGVKVKIARKERYVPEFEPKGAETIEREERKRKEEEAAAEEEERKKAEKKRQSSRKEKKERVEEAKEEEEAIEVKEKSKKPRSESEAIAQEFEELKKEEDYYE